MKRSRSAPLRSITPSAAYRAPVSSAASSVRRCRSLSSESSEPRAIPASTSARSRGSLGDACSTRPAYCRGRCGKTESGFGRPADVGSARTRESQRRPKGGAMKALVYHGPGERSWDKVPDPRIQQPTDAIVRIDSSTICGTDLHILKGDVREVTAGTVLGHEAVGTVVEIGDAVTTIAAGDRVLVSCITSCGRCRFCKGTRHRLCTGGGRWFFGHPDHPIHGEPAPAPVARTPPCY